MIQKVPFEHSGDGFRALILALSRFEITSKDQTRMLEKAWAAYRTQYQLDIKRKTLSRKLPAVRISVEVSRSQPLLVSGPGAKNLRWQPITLYIATSQEESGKRRPTPISLVVAASTQFSISALLACRPCLAGVTRSPGSRVHRTLVQTDLPIAAVR